MNMLARATVLSISVVVHGLDRESASICEDPVGASAAFLQGNVNYAGPCKTESAGDRFERYREWMTSIGGWVNPKIYFRRGQYIDEVTGETMHSVGGIFVKPGEQISQGETLFEVPEKGHFCDKMIHTYIPSFPRFMHMDMPRLWMSMGLAALIKHYPEALGPWAALLPKISYHSTLWSSEQRNALHGTHAFSMMLWVEHMMNTGCDTFEEYLVDLEITCQEAKEAHALILSRSFGMQITPGDSMVAIPLGFDFLNHNPNTHSGISRLPDNTAFFQMYSFTLPESRELFNNYGGHTMSMNLLLYGFTAPDTRDELVIRASLDGVFYGKVYLATSDETCPMHRPTGIVEPTRDVEYRMCHQGILSIAASRGWDQNGLFRISLQDVVAMQYHNQLLGCSNRMDGPLWHYLQTTHKSFRNHMGEYVLHLRPDDGRPPAVGHGPLTNYLAACSLPPLVSGNVIKRFSFDISTCPKDIGNAVPHEWTIATPIQFLALTSLVRICNHHQFNVVGDVKTHLLKWIAYRNSRIALLAEKSNVRVNSMSIANLLEYQTTDEFYQLLDIVVFHKQTIFTDESEELDQLTQQYSTLPAEEVFRNEEVHKYLMQTVFLIDQKCRLPVESMLSHPDYLATIQTYIYN